MCSEEIRAKTFLKSAVEYDEKGRKEEAIMLYKDGVIELIQVWRNESDEAKKSCCYKMIKKYSDRAKVLKNQISACAASITNDVNDIKDTEIGQVVSHIHILERTTGYDYNKLFGKYLNEHVTSILLDEPYFLKPYQYTHLTKFFELVVGKCNNLKNIMVVTKSDTQENSSQSSIFLNLVNDFKTRNIELQFKFDDTIHDRRIVLSNGYVIKIGRGLHIYKRTTKHRYFLGLQDYSFRECLDTDVTIYRNSQEFLITDFS